MFSYWWRLLSSICFRTFEGIFSIYPTLWGVTYSYLEYATLQCSKVIFEHILNSRLKTKKVFDCKVVKGSY